MSLPICVLGAGNWGTTLAVALASADREVRLWCNERELIEQIRLLGENRTFLPGVPLPAQVHPTTELQSAIEGVEAVLYVVPSQALREVARSVADLGPPANATQLSFVKGVEIPTLMRMTEVLADELPAGFGDRIAAISGPSLAREVSLGMPTAVVVSSQSEETARSAQTLLMSETLRVYTNADVVGVEMGGALKNVIAIAAGISDGLGYGDNTRGALITRGLAEMVRLTSAMGGRRETLSGLAGMGDLITTCSSLHSRNHHVGVEIAEGKSLAEIQDEMIMVAEGVPTTRAAKELALRHQVEMPIAREVHSVLFDGKDPRDAIRDLMLRRPRAEVW